MATDDQNEVTDETQDPTQAETAAEETEVETPPEKSVEELRAELEQARKVLKETNRKAASDRAKVAEMEREKQEKEDAKLSEAARARKQLKAEEDARRGLEQEVARLQAEALNLRLDREIERAAKPFFADPELAPKLVDRSQIDQDPETGKFLRVKEAVERVLRDHPGLASAGRGGGSPAAMKVKRPGSGNGVDGAPGLVEQFVQAGKYEVM